MQLPERLFRLLRHFRRSRGITLPLFALTFALITFITTPARAATVTWDGVASGDATWTNPDSNSWTTATYNNGDDAEFLGAGLGTVTLSGTINPNSVLVNAAGDYTFSGAAITGTGSLTKNGTGTLTLSNQNTYTGGTTVNNGLLDLLGSDRIDGPVVVDGAGKVTVSNPAHNNLGGITSITLQNGGTFSDNSGGTYVQSVNIPVTFNNGGTMTSEPGTPGNGGFGNWLFSTINVTGSGLATINANQIGFNHSQTITVADTVAGAATDLLISSPVRGNWVGTLTKEGAGTLTLTGASTDTSPWVVNAGTLELQNGSTIGDASAVTVNAAGTLEVDNNETIGSLTGAGDVTLNANLTLANNANNVLSGDISGTGTLVKSGGGTLNLSGDNSSHSGGITMIYPGSNIHTYLQLNSATAAGTGDITMNHFTHLYNGASGPATISNDLNTAGWVYWDGGSKALEITGDWSNNSQVVWLNSANTLTVSGVVSGTIGTGFYGGGTIALTNANNTFTGNHSATLNSTIQFGTVADSGVNSSLGAGTTIVFDGGNQSFNGYIENIGAGGSTNRAISIGSTTASRTAGIANNGTGALNFSGTFTNNGSGGGTRTLLLGGNYAGTNTISSVLSDGTGGGNIALTKEGTTTWALSGTNTYTGATSVNAGQLNLEGTLTSNVTVASGATLATTTTTGDGSGIGTTSGNIDLLDGSTALFTLFGDPDGVGTAGTDHSAWSAANFDFTGVTLTLQEGGGFDAMNLDKGDSFDFLLGAFTETTSTNFDFSMVMLSPGLNWDTSLFASSGVIQIIPEPSRALLLLVGVLGVLSHRRRN